jgi:hypothetical protein
VRALLRDILCGYLDADLRRTADDILLTSGAKPKPRAKPKAKKQPVNKEAVQEELADGVTPSADWGFDDADCYSAPV